MKKWIHAATSANLNKLIVNDNYSEDDNVTVKDAIDDMCYNTYDEYYPDYAEGKLKLADMVKIVIEHLDDPDIYGLKVGKDYPRSYIVEQMKRYCN